MTQLKQVLENQFRPLNSETLEQVWHWRNLPQIRANMHNDRLISWQEHQQWFHLLQQDPARTYLVLWQNTRPVGTLYFNQVADTALEWGCYLGEQDVWPGSGLLLEIAALDYALHFAKVAQLSAEVLPFNRNVIKMHRLFGYQEDPPLRQAGYRTDKPYDVLIFKYQLSDWNRQRTAVLARLPRQIAAAADLITFAL